MHKVIFLPSRKPNIGMFCIMQPESTSVLTEAILDFASRYKRRWSSISVLLKWASSKASFLLYLGFVLSPCSVSSECFVYVNSHYFRFSGRLNGFYTSWKSDIVGVGSIWRGDLEHFIPQPLEFLPHRSCNLNYHHFRFHSRQLGPSVCRRTSH